jgi:DNA repair protein RadC
LSPVDINIYTLKQVHVKRRRYSDLEDCQITCPLACYKLIQHILNLKSEPVEKFGIITLNTKNKLAGIHIIGSGSLAHVNVETRDVFIAAMMKRMQACVARAIIAFHNHVSGDPTPSVSDIILTRRLKEAGVLLCIQLLDHVIAGDGNYMSLKELGHI